MEGTPDRKTSVKRLRSEHGAIDDFARPNLKSKTVLNVILPIFDCMQLSLEVEEQSAATTFPCATNLPAVGVFVRGV